MPDQGRTDLATYYEKSVCRAQGAESTYDIIKNAQALSQ